VLCQDTTGNRYEHFFISFSFDGHVATSFYGLYFLFHFLTYSFWTQLPFEALISRESALPCYNRFSIVLSFPPINFSFCIILLTRVEGEFLLCY